ncbi:MAG: helix-turn-helix domain-containing protein [Oscillospiraceae bacterium]
MPAKQVTPSMRAERILKSARIAKGMDQNTAAKKLNITSSTVSRWEKDIFGVKLSDVLHMCKLYGVEPNQILEV